MPDINSQLNPKGFGAYLQGILPDDVALAAGAFSASMMQVKNIKNNSVEKVSTVAYNLETMKNLNVNGTNVPVDIPLANFGLKKLALGNGPYMTFTMSNFLGAMSGLPYNGPFKTVYNGIKELQTKWLLRTYQQLYLAVTWKQATATVQTSTYNVMVQSYIAPRPKDKPPYAGRPRIDDWYYKITGVTLTDGGGGYGRERTPYTGPYTPAGSYGPAPTLEPSVTITGPSGATAACTIDFDDTHVPGAFGKVVTLTLTNPGSPVKYATTSVMSAAAPAAPAIPNPPQCLIQAPPTTIVYPYNYAEYQAYGTTGWPVMNDVINDYVDRANKEILSIKTNNPDKTAKINVAYNDIGSALSYEQRARYTALQTLPYISPTAARDNEYAIYPTSILAFTDSIPSYASDTRPHMYAQTLEAISNWNAVGGRSMVGLSRESRNQSRLNFIGISLDNSIPDSLTKIQDSELIYNGSLPIDDTTTTPPAVLIIPEIPTQPIIEPPPIIEGLVRPLPTPYEYGKYETGRLNENQYLNIFPPPTLNTLYTRNTLSSGIYSVQEAIDHVILCNCDCWDNI